MHFFRDFIDLLTIFVYINIRREDWSIIFLGDLFTERELSLYQTVVGIYGAHLGFGHTQILATVLRPFVFTKQFPKEADRYNSTTLVFRSNRIQ